MSNIAAKIFPSNLVTIANATGLQLATNSEISNLFQHEEFHFYQYIGTSFGQFILEASRLRTKRILSYAKELAKQCGKLYVPFRRWRDQKEAIAPYRDSYDEITRLLNRSLFGTECIDRTLQEFLVGEPTIDVSYPYFQGRTLWGSLFREISPPTGSPLPTVSVNGMKIEIGATCLMESFAFYWQCFLEIVALPEASNLSSGSNWYDMIMRIGGGLELKSYNKYVAPIEYFCDKVGKENCFLYPFVVDLALACPKPDCRDFGSQQHILYAYNDSGLKKIFLQEKGNETIEFVNFKYSWEVVHPGWRFVRLVDFLANNTRLLEHMQGKHISMMAPIMEDSPLAEDILKELGWPSELSLPATYLQDAEKVRNSSYFDELVYYALKIRYKHPCAFADMGWLRMILSDLEDKGPNYREAALRIKLPVVLLNDCMVVAEGFKHQWVAISHLAADIVANYIVPELGLEGSVATHFGEFRCPLHLPNFSFWCSDKEAHKRCEKGRKPFEGCFFDSIIRKQIGIPATGIIKLENERETNGN